MYPTSPVTKTRSLRSPKSAIIAWANSSRIAGPRQRSRMRNRQLVESLRVLSIVHRQVVGSHRVLHVTNPVTLDRVGNDGERSSLACQSARARVAQREQRGEIMPVDGDDVEAEGVELRVERLERKHLLGPADALNTVAIDQPHDVGQLTVGNEERGLPGAPLVELAVGSEAKEASFASVENRPDGHAGAKREPMAQAPRGERDLLDRVDRRKGW